MSAVSIYANETTFRKFSGGKSSAAYLRDPIHSPKVTDEISKWSDGRDQDNRDAIALQRILFDIKNYEKTLSSGGSGNHQQKAAYDLLLNTFKNITNIKGQSVSQIFRRQEQLPGVTQHAFEQDMKNLNLALIEMLQDYFSLNKIQVPEIQLGGETVNISLAENIITEAIYQRMLEGLKINSVKAFKNEENKNPIPEKKKNLFRVFSEVQGKTDIATYSVEVTQKITLEGGEDILKLNELFKNATFTLKNYQDDVNIKLGNTNIGRVLYTTVNYFAGKELGSEGVLSFAYALARRHDTNKASKYIQKHLAHLQIMYELIGLGQEYTNTDIIELRDYLKEGTKFLLINRWDSDKIQVFSTKDLLVRFLDDKSRYINWQNAVTIDTKSLPKKEELT